MEQKMGIIGEFREFMKTRRALEKFISPNLASETLAGRHAGTLSLGPEIRHFQFVLVHVREDDPEETTRTIAGVVETICGCGAIVGHIACSVIDGYFGFPWPECDSIEARQKLVAALIADNGDRVRIAHGQCNGLVGNFGSKKRMDYGALIPNFSGALKTLLALEFGSAAEITC